LAENYDLHEPYAEGEDQAGRLEVDIVVLGIAIAALLLFVGTGGTVLPQIVSSWIKHTPGPDNALSAALLLNIALILFGWRRYAELLEESNDRREAEAAARKLALTDPLTGLYNRRSIPIATGRMLTNCTAVGQAVAVLMLDLDNFKKINDLNGHETGDHVLRELANRLKRAAPREALVARLGGDEFTCVLPYHAADQDRVLDVAERIRSQMAKPIETGQLVLDATVSIGIASSLDASMPDEEASLEKVAGILINRADIAMYHAKRQGRNGIVWFEPRMESDLRLRSELEAGIRRGLSRGEFEPYYQQQIDLRTGQLLGFEMLARWNSPRMGMVSPCLFIPIAEEIGLIADLSELLIRQSLEDAKVWHPSLTLSVNISPLQLRDPWFAQKLLRLLLDSNFPPARLDVEITESCLHENLGAVRSVITSLKNQGIRISLDDFGTGYSSLHQLRSLPFDQIKIDRSFVMELMKDDANPRLVEAIVSIGRGLDMPITAEGIETEAVHDLLNGMGEMKGQGFLYGRPQDARSTLLWLAERDLLAEGVDAPLQSGDEADSRAAQAG
jgi:diguanylate cyclase (GGDEF)-like protein